MINVLFSAQPKSWAEYEAPLRAAFTKAGIDAQLGTEFDPADVDYIVYAPSGPVSDFTPFTKLKAVLSLWAGVETMVDNPTLKVPLCRMVDHGLTESMVEWVTGHVLRYHLGMDKFLSGQDGVWRAGTAAPLARDRKVCVLGLGALGAACAQALVQLNFRVHGWARSPKQVEGVTCHHGADGLDAALSDADMVALLLPDTPATENVLNARSIALMRRGSFVVNPGRGPLVDDDALIAALDSGQLAHATLDVFRVEPLPENHPFWAHPKVTVTPHIAAETKATTASEVIAENIRRGEGDEPLLHVVDRAAGY
ncbi:glyoxylate/hydroxypyruvate reductase A [Litoreibacter halocynthiae]|uniref:Glyoxylate/hydroxypyruvate reductase A n=1 Tax=Litoreibacter halocynthiae TaxID=1242689 RepID=A0A4R7LHK0_9RHOB|nr:glyoxylate/hydroxypyruvate reductase A [Litoreibacter halocynthiae]TDT73996.1 glyoxylate/hydroxypyruvate reductase A [Litoreibacter halocynthiae]